MCHEDTDKNKTKRKPCERARVFLVCLKLKF